MVRAKAPRVFLLCFDDRGFDYLAPGMDEVVWDAMGAALHDADPSRPSSEQVQSWSRDELMTAYEWAMHEVHRTRHRTPRPEFTYAWDELEDN